jgi:hypothetical protein
MGIEPTYEAWEAAVLPLNYTRGRRGFYRPDDHPGTVHAPACIRRNKAGAMPKRRVNAALSRLAD